MIALPPRRQPQIQDWPLKFSSSTSHIENDAQSLSKSFPQCIDKDDHDISCLSEFYDAISPHSQQQEASADLFGSDGIGVLQIDTISFYLLC